MKNHTEQTSLRRGIFSAVMGLTFAVLLQIGASQWVSAQTSQPGQQGFTMDDVVPFIVKNVAEQQNKIGSLAVGSTMVPPIISTSLENPLNCMRNNTSGQNIPALRPCLDVNGNSTFQKLWVTPPALLDKVFATNSTQTSPGWSQEYGPKFIIADLDGNDDSMLVSGLGRYTGTTFTPQDLTTQRNVCATNNGTLVAC